VASKLDFAVIAAAICAGLLWLEGGDRDVIDPPTQAERSRPAAAAVCPDSDNMPYGASCLAYLKGRDDDERVGAADGKIATILSVEEKDESAAASTGAACPANDNAPYSARCIAFMSGWFWHSN
jgi:hypothetical protein